MSDAVLFSLIVVLIILFAGTPDLHDALVSHVTAKGCQP
jgi:hypothetical protein